MNAYLLKASEHLLHALDIDPALTPIDSVMSLETGDDVRVLTIEQFVIGDDGKPVLDDGADGYLRTTRTVRFRILEEK